MYWEVIIFLCPTHEVSKYQVSNMEVIVAPHLRSEVEWTKNTVKAIWIFPKRWGLSQYLFWDLPTQTSNFYFDLIYQTQTSLVIFRDLFLASPLMDKPMNICFRQNTLDSCLHFSSEQFLCHSPLPCRPQPQDSFNSLDFQVVQ